MVWQAPTNLDFFNAPWLLNTGIALTLISALCAICARNSFPVAYDLFCLGTFCIWFVSWRAVYRMDAPVFTWYPIFFIFLIVVLNAQVVHESRRMDPIQLQLIRVIHSNRLFQALPIAAGLGLGLYFSEYFIFYPLLVSLILIRCAFAIVIREISIG